MPNRVLFVDDESSILYTIKRQFRNYKHELLFANGGEEALKILKEQSVSVIVTDMRMPEMDGASFLEYAEKICPCCIKMVLSGHAEIDTVLSSINRGNIWRFITKPWEKEELKIAIDNAIELYESRKREKRLIIDLQKKSNELNELNKSLDKKVKERTWLISERSEILNMLIQEPDTDLVINRICNTLSKLLNNDVVILIDNQIYSNNLNIKEYSYNKEHYREIIYKGDEKLAEFILMDKKKPEPESISDIIPLIKLVIQYKLLIDQSPNILANIDKYMDKL